MNESRPDRPPTGWRANPTVRLLTRGAFARYSVANFVSLIGSWGQRVGAAWLVWEWTGSGFWLGILAMADLTPVVLTAPLAGVLADRWPRLKVNRVIQTAIAVLVAIIGLLVWFDAIGLGLLIALIAVHGVLSGLSQPARLALVQELVARPDVPTAVAINAVKSNLARLVGPAVAAIMIAQFHPAWVFLGNAAVTVIFVIVMGTLALIPIPPRRLSGGMFAQIAEGFRYVSGEPALRLVMLVGLLGGVLVRALGELLPAFADRSFEDAVTGLALLTSSLAFGAVMAGLFIGRQTDDGAIMRRATAAWAWAAAFGLAFGWSVEPWLAMAWIACSGGFIARGMILSQTFVQLRTPDEMRGRALSVHGLIVRASPALGALLIGAGIDRFGLTASVTAAALTFGVLYAIARPAVVIRSRQI